MILMGRSLCLPSSATVQELFSVARDTSIIPDISLDPVLTTFLSLDSPAALQHQYAFLQRSMNREQQTKFSQNLTAELGGSTRVTYGGVGVVALALSMLFDQVAQQVRSKGSTGVDLSAHIPQAKRVFGIGSSSRIGRLIHSYLSLVPGIANNQEKMAETTELYDTWLKLELIDHYERMTTRKRMSTVSMQQWLTGAAFHLHIRIHQVRLHSVPLGTAESLRLSYKTALIRLVKGYTAYLRKNIRETPAPRQRKPRSKTTSAQTQTNISSVNNTICSNNVNASHDRFNESVASNATAEVGNSCKTHVVNRKTFNNSTELHREGEATTLGLLVIEPWRNVSHSIQHHPCESPAIEQALVTRIINAQDLERNRNFFLYPEKLLHSLLRQRNDFELKSD